LAKKPLVSFGLIDEDYDTKLPSWGWKASAAGLNLFQKSQWDTGHHSFYVNKIQLYYIIITHTLPLVHLRQVRHFTKCASTI
jgi:hypothetical protein